MLKKYHQNKIILILPLILLGCGVANSENYPNLVNGFDEGREVPERLSVSLKPEQFEKTEVEGTKLNEVLLKFENQKGIFENSLAFISRGKGGVKIRDWYSTQLEYSKLSRVVEELEKVFRAGKPQGVFINKAAQDENIKIDKFMKNNLFLLSKLKP